MRRPNRLQITTPTGGVDARAVQQSLDETGAAINEILGKDILDGRMVPNISLEVGETTRVAHGLGRRYKGYIVVLNSEGLTVKNETALQPQKELWLSCLAVASTTTTTVSIWVF